MNWNNAEHFFAMGGHAFAVWGSYGVMAAALVIEVVQLFRRHQRARAAAASAAKENS